MTLTTSADTRLNSADDLSKRLRPEAGTKLVILARVYDGRVLKVLHDGKEWYTANPEWKPAAKVEKVEEKKVGPWDAPWRRWGKKKSE